MKAIFFVILFVHSSSIIQSLTALKNHIPVRRCEVYNKRMHSSKPRKKIKLKCKNLKLKGKLKSHNQKSSNTAMLELIKKPVQKKKRLIDDWGLVQRCQVEVLLVPRRRVRIFKEREQGLCAWLVV